MNAADTIQAAIEKLEGLREATELGELEIVRFEDGREDLWINSRFEGPDYVTYGTAVVFDKSQGPRRFATADLIVTLHRTIDAQIAILRKAHDQVSWYIERVGNKDEPFTFVPAARRRLRILKLWGEPLALARAILGDS